MTREIEPIKMTKEDLLKLNGDEYVELVLDVDNKIKSMDIEVTNVYFFDKDCTPSTIYLPKGELSSAMMLLRCRLLNKDMIGESVAVGVDYEEKGLPMSKDLFYSGNYVKESNWR